MCKSPVSACAGSQSRFLTSSPDPQIGCAGNRIHHHTDRVTRCHVDPLINHLIVVKSEKPSSDRHCHYHPENRDGQSRTCHRSQSRRFLNRRSEFPRRKKVHPRPAACKRHWVPPRSSVISIVSLPFTTSLKLKYKVQLIKHTTGSKVQMQAQSEQRFKDSQAQDRRQHFQPGASPPCF